MQNLIILSEISPFFGRFHPLFVHLPIGFVLMAYLMELASRLKKYSHLKDSILFVLWIGAISGVFTAVTGYILGQSGGYGKEALMWHQWSGIGVSLLVFVAIFIHKTKAFFPVFNVVIIALLSTGHFGGNLTHGETYLTEHLPEDLKDVFGIESDLYIVENVSYEEAELYNHLVYPIFHNKCVSCHNASKMKGELNMKDFESFLKGGENGEVMIKGNSKKSDLMQRINLAEEHEDTMPPEGKERITDDEMKLIALWIDQDRSVAIKTNERAIRTAHASSGAHDHGLHDLALLDATARDRLLDADHDGIADRSVFPLRAAEHLDALHALCTRVVGHV